MIRSKKMFSDVHCDTMDKVKKEKKKKKMKWGKFLSPSVDAVASATTPADGPKASSSSSSSSQKCKFPSLRRAFRRILSVILPCVSPTVPDESSTIETHTTSADTQTDVSSDASSSPAVSRSSESPRFDLQAANQGKEAVRDVAGKHSSPSSAEDTSSSTDRRSSDLLTATMEMEAIRDVSGESSTSTSVDGTSTDPSDLEATGGFTSSSSVGVSSSEECEKIDLLAELQAAAVLEDAAGDQTIPESDLDCILGVLASMTAQSNGLSQAEILELIQCSSEREQNEIEELRMEDHAKLADVVPTASPTSIKHLGFPNLGNTCYVNSVLQCLLTVSPFRKDILTQRERWNEGSAMLRALSDLHMTRLTGNDKKLKAKLLSTVKACIETRHPDFLGDHQQDAHEFLMVCLSHLKEEGELLRSYWPTYTCPVANMEFQLNRLRTCNSCGFQRSFREDSNYLSLVISPQGCLTDSLERYFKTSSLDCSCSECAGTTASEALELITRPRILVLLVMRFDITSSMRKLEDRLEVPVEFFLSYCTESKEMTVIDRKSLKQWKKSKKKNAIEPARSQVEQSDSITQYKLAGVVSHLGSNLYCGHYISYIRDVTGSEWLECSDNSIKKSSWSKASRNMGKNGYMLFYVKS